MSEPRPIGTARALILHASVLLAAVCVVITVVTLKANGVLVLGTIFAAVALWAAGVFRVSSWIEDEETSRRLSAVDADLKRKGQ